MLQNIRNSASQVNNLQKISNYINNLLAALLVDLMSLTIF